MNFIQKDLFIELGAEFSPDRIYRYSLWRFWGKRNGYAVFVCLNLSTADENIDDPTVRRCINFAKTWRYDGMIMLNLFALRSTDPANIYKTKNPIGPDNDFHIRAVSSKAMVTVAAWGNHGVHLSRNKDVLENLTDPMCLGTTKIGEPKHPLYLNKHLKPIPLTITRKPPESTTLFKPQ